MALDHGHFLQLTIITTRGLRGRCRISLMEIPLPFWISRDCARLAKITPCVRIKLLWDVNSRCVFVITVHYSQATYYFVAQCFFCHVCLLLLNAFSQSVYYL